MAEVGGALVIRPAVARVGRQGLERFQRQLDRRVKKGVRGPCRPRCHGAGSGGQQSEGGGAEEGCGSRAHSPGHHRLRLNVTLSAPAGGSVPSLGPPPPPPFAAPPPHSSKPF